MVHLVLHFHFPVAPCDLFSPVLITLQSDIFRGVASTDDQDSEILKLPELLKLMAMCDLALEQFNALEVRQVRV